MPMTTAHGSPADGGTPPPTGPVSYDEAVGARVRDALRVAGHSQTDLATYLGITQAAVSRKLSGRTAWRGEELNAVSHWLGVPLDALAVVPDPAVGAA